MRGRPSAVADRRHRVLRVATPPEKRGRSAGPQGLEPWTYGLKGQGDADRSHRVTPSLEVISGQLHLEIDVPWGLSCERDPYWNRLVVVHAGEAVPEW